MKKAAMALVTCLLALCLLTHVGCGNGIRQQLANELNGVESKKATEKAAVGTTWSDTGGGVSGYTVFSLACDSVNKVLYAGTASHGVWKYDGTTWIDTGGGLSSYSISCLAYDPTGKILYAGPNAGPTSYGVWKYDGTTWTDTRGAVSSYDIFSLAYDSANNLLYAGTMDHGVWVRR